MIFFWCNRKITSNGIPIWITLNSRQRWLLVVGIRVHELIRPTSLAVPIIMPISLAPRDSPTAGQRGCACELFYIIKGSKFKRVGHLKFSTEDNCNEFDNENIDNETLTDFWDAFWQIRNKFGAETKNENTWSCNQVKTNGFKMHSREMENPRRKSISYTRN